MYDFEWTLDLLNDLYFLSFMAKSGDAEKLIKIKENRGDYTLPWKIEQEVVNE